MRWIFLIAWGFLWAEPEVYHSIADLLHPKRGDYQKIQDYLKKRESSLFTEAVLPGGILFDYYHRARRFRFVGKWPWQGAKFGVMPFGCSLNDKKICVISYASYNKSYRAGIDHIKSALKKIGFRGHFMYRIGGWPDLEGGSFKLAHIPYAFKPCFLKEAYRLGYRFVLWLDASIRPMKNLESVFQAIEKRGYFFYGAGHTLAQYCNKEVMEAMCEPVENAQNIPSVAAGVFGLDLYHPLGFQVMEKWYEAAVKETPFISPRPDQNVLSILIDQLHLNEWEASGLAWEKPDDSTQFFIDWKSIQ